MKIFIWSLLFLFAVPEAAIADEFTLVCRTKKEQSRESGPTSSRRKVSYPTITLKIDTAGSFATVEADDTEGLPGTEPSYDVVFNSGTINSKPSAKKCDIGGKNEDCSGFEINRATGEFLLIARMLNMTAHLKYTGQCKKMEKVENQF